MKRVFWKHFTSLLFLFQNSAYYLKLGKKSIQGLILIMVNIQNLCSLHDNWSHGYLIIVLTTNYFSEMLLPILNS